MALMFPYTYISCPCSDPSRRNLTSKRVSREVDLEQELDADERTFDPQHPRSSFSLFPPDHLFYCEECHDIKCPRCVTEEIICWYCPSCLFESVPSAVKNDGNRCSRNCFLCPICTSQLITASTGNKSTGPWILNCNYCMWSTLDVGIKFTQPNNIRAQLDRITTGGKPRQPTNSKEPFDVRKSSLAQEPFSPDNIGDETDPMEKAIPQSLMNEHARFNALKSFYKDQILSSDAGQSSSALDAAYSSPSSLSRIMSLYGTGTGLLQKKTKPKASQMREALTASEGLAITRDRPQPEPVEYNDTITTEQRAFQYPSSIGNPMATSTSELRPMPTPLRTKRSKRCATCKHILIKPEYKITSTRYRMKLIALNYIPLVTIKPVPVAGGPLAAGPEGLATVTLTPSVASQWIMTLKNPLFENVRVSLGSPSVTPGPYGHRVTILCPQFTIGKNGDVWDDALRDGTGTQGNTGEQIAGKLYDSGRNWASVVIEIVPCPIVKEAQQRTEDEDVVEIPVRVRLEWTVSEDDTAKKRSEKVVDEGDGDDGRRELAYWMALGIGRVA